MNQPAQGPRLLAVTSGKGGVGKTNLAVNLALGLRLFGLKVLLFDADLGLANVDVLLGLDVRRDLRDVILHGWPVESVVVDGPHGLKILPGASGVEEMVRLSEGRFDGFLGRLTGYCAGMDYVVADTAPGISPAVINCLRAADETLLVMSPEPTSLTDAYALLKVFSQSAGSDCRPVRVIVNQISRREEALHSFDRLRAAANRFLKRDIDYLGSVSWDETVGAATRRQVAFLTHYSGAPCSREVRKIAARIVSSERGGAAAIGRFFKAMAEGVE